MAQRVNGKKGGSNGGVAIGRVACLYLCTIIGAGFATGREIQSFFTSYGKFSVVGILVATGLLAFLGSRVLDFVHCHELHSLPEFTTYLAGPWLGSLLSGLMMVFLYGLYVILLAGVGDLLQEQYGIPSWGPVLLLSLIALLSLWAGLERLFTLCSMAAPVIALGIALAAVLSALAPEETAVAVLATSTKHTVPGAWFLSAILYASYNGLLAVPVLAKAGHLLPRRRVAIGGGFLGALLVGAGALLVNWSLSRKNPAGAMPLVELTAGLGAVGRWCFPLLVATIMALSAVSGLGACSAALAQSCRFPERTTGVVLAGLAIPLAGFGFGPLMDFLYPAFGVAGVLLIILLVRGGKKG